MVNMVGIEVAGWIPHDELLVDALVEDEVQITLSVPRFLVLEAKVQVRQHVQTWRQEGHLRWHYAQLTLDSLG